MWREENQRARRKTLGAGTRTNNKLTLCKLHCTFVMGKMRNPPLKQWSVPRLELQEADELDLLVHSATFWMDSLTVLQYITNEKRRFKHFVANRVNEIHDASAPEQWWHVPTSGR